MADIDKKEEEEEVFDDQWVYMDLQGNLVDELKKCFGLLGHAIKTDIKNTEKQLKQMGKL